MFKTQFFSFTILDKSLLTLFLVKMATGGYQSNPQLDAARKQVDEVQNIMKSNVEKVLERDGKLSSLENRAERLQVRLGSLLSSLGEN